MLILLSQEFFFSHVSFRTEKTDIYIRLSDSVYCPAETIKYL